MSTFSKIEQLRAKTDQQLVTVIAHEVERGLRLAGSEPAEAEQAYHEAHKVLPLVDDSGERIRLGVKLEELRRALNGRPPSQQLRARAAGE